MKVTEAHYGITYHPATGHISNMYCRYCDFIVWRPHLRVGKNNCGLGKFNRMRGELVKHMHKEHRDKLETLL